MKIVTKIEEWRSIRRSLQGQIGFIPTMGHLHEGHLSLCKRAKNENTITVVSIFVNPMQFNQTQDYTAYPRTIEADCRLLDTLRIDYLFIPTEDALYPDHYQVRVMETELSQTLEGEYRPGHFTGMLTIVMKLLNLVDPHRAYFGEKDYQQLLLIQKMIAALFMDIEIIGCKTVREENGLALSSRNSRLNKDQKEKSICLNHILKEAAHANEATQRLIEAGFKVDYVAEKWHRRLAAVWLNDIRLIDNISQEEITPC